MTPLIPHCDVTIHGGLDPDGEVFPKARITMMGQPANAVLYARDVDGTQWHRADRLTEAVVTERADGSLSIEGISDELVNIVGMPPTDAVVRWDVRPWGCTSCR